MCPTKLVCSEIISWNHSLNIFSFKKGAFQKYCYSDSLLQHLSQLINNIQKWLGAHRKLLCTFSTSADMVMSVWSFSFKMLVKSFLWGLGQVWTLLAPNALYIWESFSVWWNISPAQEDQETRAKDQEQQCCDLDTLLNLSHVQTHFDWNKDFFFF